MAERHRLRALQVRVAGHHRLGLRLGEGEDDERERVDRFARLGARVEHVQAERSRDLVVPRPPGVDLAADVAEQPLDRGVHVLVRLEVAVRILRDLGEAGLRLVELLLGQQPGRGESSRVLGRRLAVVRQQLGVVDAQEAPHVGVERALDPPCPGRHAAILARCARSVQLGLERGDADEALGGLVRERLAGAVRGELGRVDHVRRAAARHDRGVRRSSTRTSPVTSSCVESTNASIASRAGLNHRPS